MKLVVIRASSPSLFFIITKYVRSKCVSKIGESQLSAYIVA